MDIKVVGGSMPVAICNVAAGETVITESGAMSWMTGNMQMDTTTGGGLGKMFKRAISGDSLLQNKYTAVGGNGEIAFAAKMPGSIRTYEVNASKSLVVQKGGFLAATCNVDLSIHFQKKLGSGFFGGEGFIMQKISGNGTVIVEIDGYAIDYTLAAGEKLVLDTGHVAVMDETCTLDIQTVPGIKNMLFGGEGLFNTVVTGPGVVTVQTMPISRFAASIYPHLPIPTSSN